MGYFDDWEDATDVRGADFGSLAYKDRGLVTPERGALGDMARSLYVGIASAADTLGTATGWQGLQGASDWMLDKEMALPDTSQYYGTQSRISSIRDMALQATPQLIGQLIPVGVGLALAGPAGAALGGAGGMGVIGRNSYIKGREEIAQERPDLPEERQHEFAMVSALSEGAGALVDVAAPLGGKAVAALSRPAKRKVLDGFLKAGFSADDVAKLTARQHGAESVSQALFGGALTEGLGEVGTELINELNREKYDLEPSGNNLLDTFLVGAILGGAISAPVAFGNKQGVQTVKDRLDAGLTSENQATRLATVNLIRDTVSNIDEEVGTNVGDSLTARATLGPVTMDELITPSEVERIQTESEEVMRENGIDPKTGETKLPLGPTQIGPREGRPGEGVVPGSPAVSARDITKPDATGFDRIGEAMDVSRDLDKISGTPERLVEPESIAGRFAVDRERAQEMQRERLVSLGLDPAKWMNLDANVQETVVEEATELQTKKARLKGEKLTLKERKKLKREIKETEELIQEEINEATPEAPEAPQEAAEVKQIPEVKAEPTTQEGPIETVGEGKVRTVDYQDGTVMTYDPKRKADRRWQVTKGGKQYNFSGRKKAEEAIEAKLEGYKDVSQKERKTIDTRKVDLSEAQMNERNEFYGDPEAMLETKKGNKLGKEFEGYQLLAVTRLAEQGKLKDADGNWDIAEIKKEIQRTYDREKNRQEAARAGRQGVTSGSGVAEMDTMVTGPAVMRETSVAEEIANVSAEAAPAPVEPVAAVTKRESVNVNKLMEGIIARAEGMDADGKAMIMDTIKDLPDLSDAQKEYVRDKLEGKETEAPVEEKSKAERVAERREREAKPEEQAGEVKRVELSEEEKAAMMARIQAKGRGDKAQAKAEKEAKAAEKKSKEELARGKEIAEERAKERQRIQDIEETILEDKSEEDVFDDREAEDYALMMDPDVDQWAKEVMPDLDDDFYDAYETWMLEEGYTASYLAFKEQFPGRAPSPLLRNVEMQMRYDIQTTVDDSILVFNDRYKNADDLLKGVQEHGTEIEKELAKLILSSKVAQEKLRATPVRADKPRSSYFRPKDGSITIGSNKMGETSVWLHEIQHAITVNEMLTNKELDSEVSLMFRMWKNHISENKILPQEAIDKVNSFKGSSAKFNEWIATNPMNITEAQQHIAYAMLNKRELLSKMFDSDAVRNEARLVKMPKSLARGETQISIWKRIKEWFSKIMQLPKGYESLLEKSLIISRELYDVPVGAVTAPTSYAMGDMKATTDQTVKEIMAKKGEKGRFDKGRDIMQKTGTNAKDWFIKTAEPISDTLRRISNPIYAKLMRMESVINSKQEEYSRQAKPFLNWYKGLTESEKVEMDVGLMNKDKAVWDKIPAKARKSLETLLGDLGDRAENVGLLDKRKDLYFPRRVSDMGGLADYLLKEQGVKGPLGVALKKRADQLGMDVKDLPDTERNQVVNSILQSGEIMQLPKPGATKERTVFKVTSDLYPFYENSSNALMAHIFEMNEKVGAREFVGGSTRKKRLAELKKLNDQIDKAKGKEQKQLLAQWEAKAAELSDLEKELDDGIHALIDKELSDKPADVQTQVLEILKARLRQKGATGIADTFRNVNYISSMGNFLSAITQLGDIPIVFYRYGIKDGGTLKSVGEAFKTIGKMALGKTKEGEALVDIMDFTNALREFSSEGKLSQKALETVFKYSGLKYTDLIGKEAALRSSLRYYQKPKNKAEFLKKYENFFENPEKVYEKIQMGNVKDLDVKTVLISELAEFQPITLSQQSQQYLTGGNLRVFYALKTFTLRTTSAAIREGYVDIKKGNVTKGALRIAAILGVYAMAGAGADELKDLAKGNPSSLKDNTIDNMLNMFFLSKYTVGEGVQREGFFKAIAANMLPPMRLYDDATADIYALMSDEKDYKYKMLRQVPLIGTAAYARTPAAQEATWKREREDILKDVKENAKRRKGARDGGITDRVRAYNRSVPREERLQNEAIMRAYKEGKK